MLQKTRVHNQQMRDGKYTRTLTMLCSSRKPVFNNLTTQPHCLPSSPCPLRLSRPCAHSNS
jgi:hypothetical protein